MAPTRCGRCCSTSTASSIGLSDVGLRRPTLDDVFLSLTGHTAEWTQEDEAAVDAESAHEHEEVLR